MQRPINPQWLLRQANELGGRGSGGGQPRNADLRPAVSAAYYALFHHVVLSFTLHVLPASSDDDGYRYARFVPHKGVKDVCSWLSAPTRPPQSVAQAALMRASRALVDVAIAFTTLYGARHEADYDHLADFSRPVTLSLIDQAADAIRKPENLKGSPERECFFGHIAPQGLNEPLARACNGPTGPCSPQFHVKAY